MCCVAKKSTVFSPLLWDGKAIGKKNYKRENLLYVFFRISFSFYFYFISASSSSSSSFAKKKKKKKNWSYVGK